MGAVDLIMGSHSRSFLLSGQSSCCTSKKLAKGAKATVSLYCVFRCWLSSYCGILYSSCCFVSEQKDRRLLVWRTKCEVGALAYPSENRNVTFHPKFSSSLWPIVYVSLPETSRRVFVIVFFRIYWINLSLFYNCTSMFLVLNERCTLPAAVVF